MLKNIIITIILKDYKILIERTEVVKIKSNADSQYTKDKIIELFYENHERQTDIAKQLNVGKSYITKIIQADDRYTKEKEERKIISLEKNKIYKRQHIQKKRQQEKQEYNTMILQINKDNQYLSKRKKVSDKDFVKWNRQMYEYDKNSSDLILKDGINVGYNVPKRVKNTVNPNCIKSQKVYV